METGTPCTDADTLEMDGIWELVTSFSFWAPPDLLPTTAGFKVELQSTGPGSHGGVLFKGRYLTPDTQPGTFSGETYYHQRGVVVLQMVMEYTPEPYCYYQLFSGKHIREELTVEGGWVDVGGHGYGRAGVINGFSGQFRLRRTG